MRLGVGKERRVREEKPGTLVVRVVVSVLVIVLSGRNKKARYWWNRRQLPLVDMACARR